MIFNKSEAKIKALALILILVIIGLSILFGIQRDPYTGNVSINPMILIWGMLIAILLYIALMLRGIRERFPIRIRFCVNCGRNIPFDAIICPYCRHDYENVPK